MFDGVDWRQALDAVPAFGINTASNIAKRYSIKSAASLCDHDGSDHQLKINKADTADTASLLLQSEYTGHAELGMAGDDSFRLPLSPVGISWSNVLCANPSTERIEIQTDSLAYTLDVNGLIGSTSTSPGFYLNETDQAADERIWRVTGGGSNFFVQALNDAGTVAQQAFVMTRDGVDLDSIRLLTEGTIAAYVGAGQNVGIAKSAPTDRQHVERPVRFDQYASANLPSASGVGAGTIAYITDAVGGAQLAYSDSTDWRKFRDGAVV